jgi:hypothetical protein
LIISKPFPQELIGWIGTSPWVCVEIYLVF